MKYSVVASFLTSLIMMGLIFGGLYVSNFYFEKSNIFATLGIIVIGLFIFDKFDKYFETNFKIHLIFSFFFSAISAFIFLTIYFRMS